MKNEKQLKKNKKTVRSKATAKKKATEVKKVKELKEEVDRLKKDIDKLNDKYLRVVAEFDNYKKRKDKEIQEIFERANEQFCLELLPVIDDFERSLNSESATKRKSYKSLKHGIELIFQKFSAILKKQGIEPIDSVGQPFDPELHEAIMQVENKEEPSNLIVDEALKGYRLRDRVLRYSQVVVNK